MTSIQTTDFLIIGGGVIGLCLSLELKKRFPDCSIAVLEKEKCPGEHASGRNSGVLHAGFYYTANSLKARLCREGNRQLTEYCIEHNIAVNRCGKLVVAQSEQDLITMDELLNRGGKNKVKLDKITQKEAEEIEPHCQTLDYAIFSPSTSSVNPRNVMQSLCQDAAQAGIKIITQTKYSGRKGNTVNTNLGFIEAGYIINAAGLYADKIAKDFGFSNNYQILPFKGIYLTTENKNTTLNTHIYPVPDLVNPFLGVHFTVTVSNQVKIGPTSIPAFWRENYQGMDNFSLNELKEITGLEAGLLFNNRFGFGKLALREIKKHSRTHLIKLVNGMVKNLDLSAFKIWGKPGIRAQLINTNTRTLEMDFIYEGDNKSFHILNAVSPAFTCSMSFSSLAVDEIQKRMKRT